MDRLADALDRLITMVALIGLTDALRNDAADPPRPPRAARASDR
jgi:hypothetical protein